MKLFLALIATLSVASAYADLVCETDLVDGYGQTVRQFTASGWSEDQACQQSALDCKVELARNDSYGYTCQNIGIISDGDDQQPQYPQYETETCTINRYDPAGMFIQSYSSTASGPYGSDVMGQACSQAQNECYGELRGRQTCRQ
jgi:hypothetical protein